MERINFLASTHAPNPLECVYWIDLTANSQGAVIKYYDNSNKKWDKISAASDNEPIIVELENKVDKVAGKQLSTNDYTSVEKTKLAGIATNATNTPILNALNSTLTTQALSAAQGKVLKDLVDALTIRVTALEAKP